MTGSSAQLFSPGEQRVIPAREARIVRVPAGDTLRVIDVEGQQVADVVPVSADDPAEILSGIVTTQFNKAAYPKSGMTLYSAGRQALMQIGEDTVGVHDLLMGACSSASYALRYGAPDHPNCQALLQGVLHPLGVRTSVPSTFNAFMNVPIAADGALTVEAPRSKAGDYVDLLAIVDCWVAVAACPADLSPCNGWNPTAIALELRPRRP